jgi:type VI secretion system protein ImpK
MNPNEAASVLRSNSLALAFQDVITVILRVRYRTQKVMDAIAFRDSIRKMIAAGAQEVRRLGYSDQTSQMALYAIIGFLDESVLNSGDPTFQDWSRRPLQGEMFGGHFAGEYFFRHLSELLNQPDSQEVADVLELHAICLLLGYRGKFALGEDGEVAHILRRIREKIERIRGPHTLSPLREAPVVPAVSTRDPWIRRLLIVTAVSAAVVILGFLSFWYLLGVTLNEVATHHSSLGRLAHSSPVAALVVGGLAK